MKNMFSPHEVRSRRKAYAEKAEKNMSDGFSRFIIGKLVQDRSKPTPQELKMAKQFIDLAKASPELKKFKEDASSLLSTFSKSINLSIDIDPIVEYCGQISEEFWQTLYFTATTVASGYVTVYDKLYSRTQIPINNGPVITLTDKNCVSEVTPGDKVARFTTNELAPIHTEFFNTICPEDDIYATFLEVYAAPSANPEVPRTILDVIIFGYVGVLNEIIENLLWNGDTSLALVPNLNRFDGWIKKFLADSTVIDVVAAAHDETNIKTEYRKVYTQIPTVLTSQEGFKRNSVIFANPADMFLIDEYLTTPANTNANLGFSIKNELYYYQNIEIVFSSAIPLNQLVYTKAGNLWVGYNAKGEVPTKAASFEIDNMPKPNQQNIYIKGVFGADVSYAFGKYIIYSRTA